MEKKVIFTQQDKLWNGGKTKEIPLSKDQRQMGGKHYTNDRLNRAANGDDGYTDGRSSEQAEMALEAQREAINNGAEVKTEKIDIYMWIRTEDYEVSLRLENGKKRIYGQV